ncbi:mycofactocin biosynthesis glycosyltransferase MftF [Herbiconiux sp. L3-i23]|uniref:mycofactocin biosynthesis glycosyltransferase MftF n=1 Tax=Herbiconiux sp. L3-i23 TaxID=2905871 RepID=UPI00204DCF15|nr:mycofactocin biosynthesis glycosyltransferase MftF [Herbiconiux sp. L3-i23]BDI22531.1 glycosyl transferase family 2 [Herbiconiux sp. L3-i23]
MTDRTRTASWRRSRRAPAPTVEKVERIAYAGAARIAWTTGVRLRAGRVIVGGSPSEVTVLPPDTLPFARRLFAAGRAGLIASNPVEQRAALELLDRGIADPLPMPAGEATRPTDVDVVVPVRGDAGVLADCLAALAQEGLPVTVVDDASEPAEAARIRRLTLRYGARLVVRETNGGPGAARATGVAATERPFVAFVDADVVAAPAWVSQLRPLFDDPLVGAVAPRVGPLITGASAIEGYEQRHSSVDMGEEPSRVVYGVPVNFLPTASVIVRRSALPDPPFDPELRVGEDVDLFWRMSDAGWTVRYAPDVVSHHRVRTSLRDFVGRRVSYGTGAASLDARHPNRLIPAWLSVIGLSMIAVLTSRHRWVRALVLPIAALEFLRQRRVLGSEVPASVAVEMTGRSLYNDAYWLGHLLRREWWPIGWAVLAVTPFSRVARVVAACMMWPPIRDHILSTSRVDPARGLALRMMDDASYGTGVIVGAARRREFTVIGPRVHVPRWTKA